MLQMGNGRIAVVVGLCAIASTAEAGQTDASGPQSFRGIEFSGNINCVTRVFLSGPYSTELPNETTGALVFDRFEWGNFSMDGADLPEGAYESFLVPTETGRLLLYNVRIHYDATNCGPSSTLNLDYHYYSYGGAGTSAGNIYAVAGPDGIVWSSYTSGGVYLTPGASSPIWGNPRAYTPGDNGGGNPWGSDFVDSEVGVWFPPETNSGNHVIQTYVTATLNY